MSSGPDTLDVLFTCEGVDLGVLHPRRVSAIEEISRGIRVDVDLVLPDGKLNAPALRRKGAEVVFQTRETSSVVRRFGGIVTSVRETAKAEHRGMELSVTIEAPMAILERSADFVIHQKESTKDIVASLCDMLGVKKVEWSLSADPPKREVCTQFGETMAAFAARLLEEDGIFWFVKQGDDGPTIVFGDQTAAYAPTSPAEIPFAEGQVSNEQRITGIVERARVRPAKVTFRDHDFKNPPLDPKLEVHATKASPFDREDYSYPGRYTTPTDGERLAKVRLGALDAEATNLEVIGFAPSLSAGHAFKLVHTPLGAFDSEWLVVRVVQTWSVDEPVATQATLIPKTQVFRPLQVTPKPVALPCTALVSVPAGEEIHCDEFGRLRLRFMWDRYGAADEKTSGWARVGQMHTSGSVLIPRGGWEVLVDFEDGDPDKPVVLGRLYNGKDGPAQPLPANKTQSMLRSFSTPGGGGHNEIKIEDAGGKEQIHVHAQKLQNLVVANDKSKKVTTNATFGVVADEKRTVGANETHKVGAKDSNKVGGSQKWSVGAVRTKTTSGTEGYEVKGSRSQSIGAAHITTTPKSETTTTSGSMSETVGGVYLAAAGLGTSIATAGATSLLVGAAKIEAVAAGKADITIGARASTIGGAQINLGGKDVATNASAVKSCSVGGAWMTNAGGKGELTAKSTLSINVGGAVIMNGTTIVLKVGGSNVTVAGGGVTLTSQEIKLTASGPNAESAPMVGSK